MGGRGRGGGLYFFFTFAKKVVDNFRGAFFNLFPRESFVTRASTKRELVGFPPRKFAHKSPPGVGPRPAELQNLSKPLVFYLEKYTWESAQVRGVLGWLQISFPRKFGHGKKLRRGRRRSKNFRGVFVWITFAGHFLICLPAKVLKKIQ